MKVGRRATHIVRTPERYDGRTWTYSEERRLVTVLAISGRYAMVRRPRAMPYVALVAELVDAVDPHADSTGKPPTRVSSSGPAMTKEEPR